VSEWERLKQLLLGEERDALSHHAGRLDALERNDAQRATEQDDERARLERLEHENKHLSRRLPRLIERAEQKDSAHLTRALSGPVATALAGAVRKERQTIVDALFPVIGPAIRKAIAEALRTLVADLNRALESSLTPRGLRWRIESWRTGAPYAQVVLKHTLRWRIDHLFLIEHDSGLVMHRESAPDLPDLDSDAVAGMLTAIGEFVKDSMGRAGGGALESARVGEHGLWVLEGPRANLAAFIRGVPPQRMRAVLQRRLEEVHARLGDPLAPIEDRTADPGTAIDEMLAVAAIDRETREDQDQSAHRSSRTPLLVVATIVIAVLVGGMVRGWMWSQRMGRLEARLRDWPGLHLQSLRSDPFDSVRVRGLVDPLADPLVPALKSGEMADVEFDLDLRGYVSTDDAILARRARAALNPPEGATLAVERGVLVLGGSAPADWIASANERAALMPGITGVRTGAMDPRPVLAERIGQPEGVTFDFSDGVLAPRGTAPLAWIGRLRDESAKLPAIKRVDLAGIGVAEADALDALRRELSTMQVDFATGSTDATDDGTAMLARLLPELRRAFDLAAALGIDFRVRTYGLTDASGDPDANAALRARRAQWLADALASEFPELDIVAGDDAGSLARYATLDRRAALLELDEVQPTP
jgi:outer membrane protein OmpA-like peptidoglycan-associated protein